MSQDYQTVKINAQLRVVRDPPLGFTIEYMNPNCEEWEKLSTFLSADHALRVCSEISTMVQDQPILKYEIQNFDAPVKPKKNPFNRFEYGE